MHSSPGVVSGPRGLLPEPLKTVDNLWEPQEHFHTHVDIHAGITDTCITVKPPNKGHVGNRPVVSCPLLRGFLLEISKNNTQTCYYNIFCFISMFFFNSKMAWATLLRPVGKGGVRGGSGEPPFWPPKDFICTT